MSHAAAREHWRFLLGVLLLLIGVGVAGPFVLVGIAYLFGALIDRFGEDAAPLMALVFAVLSLGWLFLVLVIGARVGRGGEEGEPAGSAADPSSSSRNGEIDR